MRIATLIVGLLLGLLLTIQSMLFMGLSGDPNTDPNAGAGAAGFVMAILWLISCGLVIGFPMASVALFSLAGFIGIATNNADFGDLPYFGGISFILAGMAFLGWRGKRREDDEREQERSYQRARDRRLEALLTQRDTHTEEQSSSSPRRLCRSCGSKNAPNNRFCAECGADLKMSPLRA